MSFIRECCARVKKPLGLARPRQPLFRELRDHKRTIFNFGCWRHSRPWSLASRGACSVFVVRRIQRIASSSTLVRAARRSRRITQARLAELTGIDQASVSHHERGRDAAYSTVDRLLAGTGHRLYAAPTRRDDAASSAEAIRQHLRADDTDRALRALLQLNDNLTAEHGLVRGILGLTEPERTGDRVWDAAIAALVHGDSTRKTSRSLNGSTTPIAH
ncbi:helix-turn-helix domain-containing protein [Cryobacterium lactosi]|uniref:helix-turn-helix domain-containing protein n=1 Tax=Cryobacterium lactosi TaxID=1259202 RepID=UPI003B973FC2